MNPLTCPPRWLVAVGNWLAEVACDRTVCRLSRDMGATMTEPGRAHNNGDCNPYDCRLCDHEDQQRPRLIVEADSAGDEAIWDQSGNKTTVVLWGYDVDDEKLWAAIKGLVESGGIA